MSPSVRVTDTWTREPLSSSSASMTPGGTGSPMGTAQFSTVKTPPSFRAWADSVLPVLVWAVKVATVSAVYSLGVTLAVRYHTAFSRS